VKFILTILISCGDIQNPATQYFFFMWVTVRPAASRRNVLEADQAVVLFGSNTSRNVTHFPLSQCFFSLCKKGVTKRCRLSLLTNSALLYEPKCGGRGGGNCGVSAIEYSCTQEPRINFGDLTLYLTYACKVCLFQLPVKMGMEPIIRMLDS
jgi:hypothetical protein